TRVVAVLLVERVSRFACLWIDAFVAAAAERSEPALRAEPLAVVAPAPTVTRVIDANAAAREYGVGGGMTETEARARCSALVSRPFVEGHVRSARHALLEAAFGVSPRVEDGGAGLVYVDAAGLAWLHGDPVAIGRRLWSQARAVGFPGCRVALAGSRTAARVAALNATEPVTVIPPGEERAALAAAPLAVLGLAPDLAVTLEGWGVRTVGELAALPRDGLAMRLGPAGLRTHDLALGLDRDPFAAWTPPAFWDEAQGLEWEIDSLGALTVVLAAVLERLCTRLVAASLAADALAVRLERASCCHHAGPVPRPRGRRDPFQPTGSGPRAPRWRGAATEQRTRAAWSRDPWRGGRTLRQDPSRSDAHTLVLRRVRPPKRVAVATADERPSRVDGRRIVGCAGPWRASGGWWDKEAWARDEWDVALVDGTLCRLARDLRTGQWCVDGVYD